MSDPITNIDIEDVLSSIRRLVSEQPAQQERTLRSKLVLTPDCRVSAQEANPAPASPAKPVESSFVSDSADQQTLEERIAELEQAVAASANEWEPDGSEAGAGTLPEDFPPVFTATKRPEPDVHARPWATIDQPKEPETAQKPSEESAGFYEDDGEETIIDEEMLRDLVAEIVREELQGALGERITRNVRKLVRAEIQRALAAHNFS